MKRAGAFAGTAIALVSFLQAPTATADDLSGADKLRVIWSNQMSWTPAGLPIVTVGVLDGRDEVRIEGLASAAGGVRLLPDGEGGAEVRGGRSWSVRVVGAKPAVIHWHVVVATGRASEAEALQAESARWRERGFSPHTFETGTVFGLRGEVIDMRRLMIGVDPRDTLEKARAAAAAIGARYSVDTGLHAVVVERPHGMLEARDERGAVVKNEGVLWFAPPTDEGTLTLPDVPREAGGSERRNYAGKLYVTIGSDGKLAAANAVSEDRLLAGLLPAEIGASAPPEALKAQAVAARNELLAKLGTRHLTDPYRLCSKVHCQVYAGADHEDPRAGAAIAATRGELLVRPDGTLVDAVYSSSCGGHTEDNDKAWGTNPDPSLRGVLDVDEGAAPGPGLADFAEILDPAAFLSLPAPRASRLACAAAASFRWSATASAKVVEQKLQMGLLRDASIEARGVSGRVIRMKVVAARGTKEIKNELEIRRLFGNLKSSLFTFTVERGPLGEIQSFHFNGGGHGHGVGMCQSGATHLATTKTYKEILSHYYKDTRLKRFY